MSGAPDRYFRQPTAVATAWAVLPVVVAVYALLRYALHGQAALVASQVVFLAPPLFAAAFSLRAAQVTRVRSRGRVVWGLLASAMVLLTIGEAIGSFMVVATPADLGPYNAAIDSLNVVAAASFVGAVITASMVDLMGRYRLARVVLDTVIVASLALVAVYQGWLREMLAAAGMVDTYSAIRYSTYAVVGVLIAVGNAMTVVVSRRTRGEWTSLVAFAVGVFATGVVLWPLWSLSVMTGTVGAVVGALPPVLYMLGYYAFFIAALERVIAPDLTPKPRVDRVPAEMHMAMGVVLASLVLVAVSWLSWIAFKAPAGSVDRFVALLALCVATLALVIRTNLVSTELNAYAAASEADPLTGMSDAVNFERQLDAYVSVARFGGAPVAVLLVDVDSFAEIDTALGRAGGDRVLAEVASVIKEHVGRAAEFYRLSGDGFGLIAPGLERVEAAAVAEGLVTTFRGLSAAGGRQVTVSIGYAGVPEDALDPHEALLAAEHALRWAKMRGKARAVGYDLGLGRSTLDADIETGGRSASRDMVQALSAAADARDAANVYHSRNVAALSRLVAVSLGFEPERVRRVEVAGLLHDAGVIALPDVAIGRGGDLTESAAGREHSVLGAQLLAPLGMEGVSEWVRSHHERWDGAGYPDGLKGDQIPLEARIVSLSDAFDGMTSGKRYGVAMSKWAALQEIDLNIGVRFDPMLAERFIAIVGRTSVLGWSDEWRKP